MAYPVHGMEEPLFGHCAAGGRACLALIGGLICGEVIAGRTPALLAVVLLVSALVTRRRWWWGDWVLLGGIFCLGMTRGEAARIEADRAAAWTRCHAGTAWMRGELTEHWGTPQIALRALRGRTDTRVREIDPPIRLLVRGSLARAGERTVEGFVQIETASGKRFPGAWDDRPHLAAHRAGGWLRPQLLIAVEEGRRELHLDRAREHCAKVLARHLPGDPGTFAARFLLGRRVLRGAGHSVQWRLERAGVAHLWAVSGLHVGILLGVLLFVSRAVGLDAVKRGLLVALLIPLYACATGASSAALRAGLMGSLWCVMRACGRRAAPRDLLIWVLAATLWTRPAAWQEPGVQMSYLITLGILGLLSGGRGGRRRWAPALVAGAQLTAWPLQLAHFGWGSPFFVLSNALIVPLAALLMPVLLASLLLVGVPGYPADVALAPVRAALEGQLLLVDGLGSLCDCWVLGGRVTETAGVLMALLIVLICSLRRLGIGARLMIALALCAGAARFGAGEARLLMLDVGQGEGWLLCLEDETWAVDLGPPPGSAGRGRDVISRTLRSRGRTRIDRLFLTHNDRDHTGGITELLARDIEVRHLYHPCRWSAPEALRDLEYAECHEVARGDRIAGKGVLLDVLHPPRTGEAGAGDNARSLALRIRVGDLTLLLTGDVPGDVQRGWCADRLALECAIVTAAHHGSAGSTPDGFLASTGAQLLLISAGRNNHFGHPAPEVLAAARRRGIAVLRTDRDGTITIRRREGGWIAQGSARRDAVIALSTAGPSVVRAP